MSSENGAPEAQAAPPAVVDAYLGAHQDVDLGAVTGRIAVLDPAEATATRTVTETEVAEEIAAEDDGDDIEEER